MIQAAIRLAGLLLVGFVIAYVLAAVLGISPWLAAGILVGLALLEFAIERQRDPDPPDRLEQTGGFPRSRR